MSHLLSLSLGPSILLFACFGLVLYGVSRLVLAYVARHAAHDPLSIPVAAFIGTVATTWALSLGFVAADIWALNAQADRALSAERSSIHRLIGNSHTYVLDMPELGDLLRTYREQVIQDEWLGRHNLVPAPAVETTLQEVRGMMMDLARSDLPQPIIAQTIAIFGELQQARDTRLAIANTVVDQYKWYMLMTLTVLTAVSIAAVHADRPRAGRRALTIYVLTAIMSLWILVIHGSPYGGVEQIRPEALYVTMPRPD